MYKMYKCGNRILHRHPDHELLNNFCTYRIVTPKKSRSENEMKLNAREQASNTPLDLINTRLIGNLNQVCFFLVEGISYFWNFNLRSVLPYERAASLYSINKVVKMDDFGVKT